MEGYIGGIVIFAGNFAPRSWAFCNGQLIAISQNEALFSIIGCTFGGDCRTSFALPDLRGRIPTHVGSGAGINPISLGQKGGANNINLIANNLPSHNHLVNAHGGGKGSATTDNPQNALPGDANDNIYSTETPDITMNTGMLQNNGANQQFSIMQPYLGLNYIIALFGIFPSRA